MTDLGEILVVIPARGCSKRLPRKNLLPLAGKPMICWTIDAAIAANLGGRVMVSSDDDEILAIAREYESQGVIAYKRSDELATDIASTADVLFDAVITEQAAGYDPKTIILLQPTSPLRISEDITEALSVYRDGGCENTVVSVCQVDHPTAWIGTLDNDSRIEGIDLTGRRSQEYKEEYRLNGAVYVISVDKLLTSKAILSENMIASIMPRSRSFDIDEKIDLKICEALIKN